MPDIDTGRFDAPRQKTPASLLDEARRELSEDILRGDGGRRALARYSERLDALIAQLVAVAPQAAVPVALISIGGYGRRQLCLHSDIDLLILFGGPIGDAEERVLRAVLHPLWD